MISEQLFTWEQPKRENRSSMVSDHFTVYRQKKEKKMFDYCLCVVYFNLPQCPPLKVVDIADITASRLGKYPLILTSSSVNNC